MTNSNKDENLREVPKRICPYTRGDYDRETKEIETQKKIKRKNQIRWSQQRKKINIDHIYDLWFGKESVDNRIIIVMMCLIIAFIAIPVGANFFFHKKVSFNFFALIDIYISIYIVIVYGNKYLKQGCLKKFIHLVAIIWILPYMLIKFIFEKIFKLKTLFGHIEWMLVIIMLSMTIEIVSYI